MRVYGNQIESGGMELDDDTCQCDCEHCGGSGTLMVRHYQRVDGGSVNSYRDEWCEACDYGDAEIWD